MKLSLMELFPIEESEKPTENYVCSPARTQWAAFTGDVLTFHGKGESPWWALNKYNDA